MILAVIMAARKRTHKQYEGVFLAAGLPSNMTVDLSEHTTKCVSISTMVQVDKWAENDGQSFFLYHNIIRYQTYAVSLAFVIKIIVTSW